MRSQPFLRTHDLIAIRDLCQRIGIILPVNEDDLDKLSAFAVEVRYPGIQPTSEEAREALQTAKAVRKFARKILGAK